MRSLSERMASSCLLEIQIERQRSCQIKRKLVLVCSGKILHRSSQRQNFQMKLNRPICSSSDRGAGSSGTCNTSACRNERSRFSSSTSNRLRPSAIRSRRPSGYSFVTRDNLSRASDFGNAFFQSANHSEGRVVGQAFADHLFVSRLENVQGQGSAREAGQRRAGTREEEPTDLQYGTRRPERFSDCTTCSHVS